MSLPSGDYLIVSCEHGGNRVPPCFRKLFSEALLSTHRGYDPGALALARDLAAASAAPLFYSTISRLLVELNRPPGHPQVFSVAFPEATREALLRRYYFHYWKTVEARVAQARGRVLHLSCHSFTPRLRGVRRTTDIGLLFDPARRLEARFAQAWLKALREHAPRMRVRNNDPYPGTHPSLVQSLREKFGAKRYVGIQIEVNQRFPRGGARRWKAVRGTLLASFQRALQNWSG